MKLQEHINIPVFPEDKSPDFYETCLTQYLSKVALDQLPHTRPLWEIHLFKYRTKNAAGSLIFKLHHSLGDGYSLMGALLSCLQRADNPQAPLTFPSLNAKRPEMNSSIAWKLPRFVTGVVNTVIDFGWSLLKSSLIEDDRMPIRSGQEGVEYLPITISTLTFSLDQIKKIRATLNVVSLLQSSLNSFRFIIENFRLPEMVLDVLQTINDVICGVLFLGIRQYMKAMDYDLRNAQSTALVLLNTRNIAGYKSVSDMVHREPDSAWGNQFAFLHVPVPDLATEGSVDPLGFVLKARELIKRKRESAAVVLTGKLLETLRKYRGPEVHPTFRFLLVCNYNIPRGGLISIAWLDPGRVKNQT